MCGFTYDCEVHDFENPDGHGQVHQYQNHQEQDKEIQASFPPAINPHFVHLWPLGARHGAPVVCVLFLGHLKETRGERGTHIKLLREGRGEKERKGKIQLVKRYGWLPSVGSHPPDDSENLFPLDKAAPLDARVSPLRLRSHLSSRVFGHPHPHMSWEGRDT